MNTVSIVGSVSRRAGGLFESVRRLHGELLAQNPKRQGGGGGLPKPGDAPNQAGEVRVQVLSLHDEFTDMDLSAWEPVPVRSFACYGPRAYGYAPGLRRELFNLAPDLAHIHGLWQFTSVATLAWHQRTHRPYLVSPHGMLDPWAIRHSGWKKGLSWWAYERAHLRSATCIRALSQAEVGAIRALGLVNPVCVIPNGVDLPPKEAPKPGHARSQNDCRGREFPEPANVFGSNPGGVGRPKVLLYLGRLHPKKGLAGLLRAWAKVQSKREWILVIAGWDQSGHEAELQRLADDLAIPWSGVRRGFAPGSSLFFVGAQFRAAKDAWLRRCDAFVLPSFSEGLPMAVLEAWAHAKPVLMTRQCNLPEGLAAAAALPLEPEPEAIATRLRDLFGLERSARERIGSRGRELVATRFSWPRIADELKAVYSWMTGAGYKPPCVSVG